ncbi:MAG: serine/threonine-protein kinase [Pirellulales bacterium]
MDGVADDKLIDELYERWRVAFTTRGEDIPLPVLCPERPDLHRELKGLIQFEKLNLGGPIPQIISAETRYEILGRYEADHEGGQGELFLARDPRFPRVVLIKRIQTSRAAQQDAIVKFRREMLLHGQLEHPNIVPVFDCGEHAGELFLAMRLVPGDTYHRLLVRLHESPPAAGLVESREFRTLLQHLATIAKTVAYAHSRSALHLDISTANIRVGEHGEVYLLDWGAGRRDRVGGGEADPRGSPEVNAEGSWQRPRPLPVRTDVHAGPLELASSVNPAFMSPEQAMGHRLTRATDVYQLGAVLYVLLAGRYPFSPERPGTPAFQELATRVIRGERNPWPRELRIPGPLRSICDRAMAVDASRRYATAEQFAEELELWSADLPIGGHAYTWSERLALSRRRHSGRWLAAGAVLATTVAALAIGSGTLVSRNRELAASRERTEAALARVRTSQQQVDELLAGAFRLARLLGDGDLDSPGRLAALDQQLAHLGTQVAATDPTHLRCLAAVQQGRCQVLARLNRFQEAIAAGEEARRALERLLDMDAATRPSGDDSNADRRALASVLHELSGVSLDQYQSHAGRDYLVAALSQLQAISAEDRSPDVELRLLQCLVQRRLGRYYEQIGNVRKALDARRLALAESAAALGSSPSDDCRLEHAQSLRLVARSELAAASVESVQRTGYLRQALLHAEEAVELLEACSRPTKDAVKWQEARYYVDSCLAQVFDEQHRVGAAAKQRSQAIQRLERLRERDPARAEWLVSLISEGIQSWFRSDSRDLKQMQDGLRTLDQLAREASELQMRYPENVDLRSGGFQWAAAFGRLLTARDLSGSERERVLEEAVRLGEESDRMLRAAATTAPTAFEFVRRRDVLLGHQSELALLQGDREAAALLRVERAGLQPEFYQRRRSEEPEEITWEICLLDARVAEAQLLWQGSNWAETAQRFRELEEPAQALAARQPDSPHLLMQQSRILSNAVDAEFNAEFMAKQSVSSECLERQSAACARILQWRRNCCASPTLTDRSDALAQYTETLAGLRPSIRRDELLLQGAFLNRFGRYRPFVRYIRSEVDRLMDKPSIPEVLARNAQASSTRLDAVQESDLQAALPRSLKQLELTALAAHFGAFDYDDEQLQHCLARIRLLRELGSGNISEAHSIEAQWNARFLAAALAAIQRGGDKGKYYGALRARVREDLQSVRAPDMSWSALQPADAWREMDYASILSLAMGAGRTAKWFELMDAEFKSAAELPKSEGQTTSYGEHLVARRMLDDVLLQPPMRADVLQHARSIAEPSSSMTPALRDCLAAVALLSRDDELAKRLAPDLNHQSLEGVVFRIVENALEARNVATIRESLEVWCVDERFHPGNRARLQVNLSECYLLEGRNDDALRVVDELLAMYPTWNAVLGLRWKILLEQHRSSPDLVAVMGTAPQELIAADLTVALVAQYLKVAAHPQASEWERLKELATDPRVADSVWAWELVGDGARRVGNEEAARDAYQRAQESFPPTVDPSTAAYRRVQSKLPR